MRFYAIYANPCFTSRACSTGCLIASGGKSISPAISRGTAPRYAETQFRPAFLAR